MNSSTSNATRTPTMQAIFHGQVIAESDRTQIVEGNHYFPESSIRPEFFTPTKMKSVCPWKGVASYYTVQVDGVASKDAAWQYRKPFPLARKIKGHVAFWGGVQIVEKSGGDQ